MRMLGRYALYAPIASGGMATVHLGRLLGPVGFARTVAIKRLHENFARDPQFVAMFVDEARLAARIQHPNVVDMLDVITTQGELFLVLGYVQGESLATLFQAARSLERPVPVGVVVGIIVGVLHGLHAAHEARSERGEPLGIVHRDVSPHNVLVGVDGIPRLLDFGVAKAAGRMRQSLSGEIKGKLGYMGPEQLRGTADRRTDVYSTSVMLWEGLTGKRLLSGDKDAMVLHKLLDGNVDPPSLHASGVSRELDALVLRGLAAEPSARFATAREMARALEGVVAVASASAVGEWVDTLVHDRLADRAREVEIVEESSSSLGPSRSSDLPGPSAGTDHARADARPEELTRSLPGRTPDVATMQDDAPTLIAGVRSIEPSRRWPRQGGRLALYGAIALAVLALWGLQRRNPPQTLASRVPPPSNAPPQEEPVTPTPPALPEAVAPPPSADATKATLTGGTSKTPRPTPRPSQAASRARAGRDLERAFDTRK